MRCSVVQAVDWIAARSPEQEMAQREEMICKLEEANSVMWSSGVCRRWFEDSDDHIRAVAGGANGPLFEELLRASRHVDPECVSLLSEGACLWLMPSAGTRAWRCVFVLCLSGIGAKMIGELERSGVGTPVEFDTVKSIDDLWRGRMCSNRELLSGLREDEHAEALFQATRKDAAVGRMSEPVLIGESPDLLPVLLHPRFPVVKAGRAFGCTRVFVHVLVDLVL